MEKVMLTDDIAINTIDAVASASFDLKNDAEVSSMEKVDEYNEEFVQSKPTNTALILWIVVAVCLVAGVVLGIFTGKRAANK